jgi:hypothetical protein
VISLTSHVTSVRAVSHTHPRMRHACGKSLDWQGIPLPRPHNHHLYLHPQVGIPNSGNVAACAEKLRAVGNNDVYIPGLARYLDMDTIFPLINNTG